MHPILFDNGTITIYSYSVYLTAACILALGIAMREARLRKLQYNLAPVAGSIAIFSGFIGARLLYVALNPAVFAEKPLEIFRIWNGGMLFPGAIIFGSMGALIFLKSKRQPVLPWTDSFAPALAMGIAIGRIGCFFAGCCHGIPASVPWAVTFMDPESLAPVGTPLHPTQLYYSLSGLVIFAAIMIAIRFIKKHGTVSGLFLTLFASSHFLIEFFRADHKGLIGQVSLTQLITLAFLSIGVYLLLQKNYGSN